jgi:hypothetical protein
LAFTWSKKAAASQWHITQMTECLVTSSIVLAQAASTTGDQVQFNQVQF